MFPATFQAVGRRCQLQTPAQDPPLLVGAAGRGEAAGETGLSLGDLV